MSTSTEDTPPPPPIRCTSCQGTGEGQTVVTGTHTYKEPCGACGGNGQL
ncbi:hypothetical protein [Streptomyces palmae]|nr:hypothetical protein [Streptomyces palmae]